MKIEPLKNTVIRGGVYFIKDQVSNKNTGITEHPYLVISKAENTPVIVAPISSHYKDVPTGLPMVTLTKDNKKVLTYVNAFPMYMAENTFKNMSPSFIMDSEFVDFIVRIIFNNYVKDENIENDIKDYKNRIDTLCLKEYHEEVGYVTRTTNGGYKRVPEHPNPPKTQQESRNEKKKSYYIKPAEKVVTVPDVSSKNNVSASDAETQLYLLSQISGFEIINRKTAKSENKLSFIVNNKPDALKAANCIDYTCKTKTFPDNDICEEFLRIVTYYGFATIAKYVGVKERIIHLRYNQIREKLAETADQVIKGAEEYKTKIGGRKNV